MPQLDYYLSSTNKDVVDLKKANGLEDNTKIILYTTGSPRMIPYEEHIILRIWEVLNKLTCSWYLLVRLHPQDKLEKYECLKDKPNVKIEDVSSKKKQVLDGTLLFQEDIDYYGSLLRQSDVVINIASTVTLDALALGRNVVNVAFDDVERPYYQSVKRFYNFNHMQQLVDLRLFPIAYSPEELLEEVSNILNSETPIEKEQEAIQQAFHKLDGKSGYRVAELLSDLIKDTYAKN